MFPELTDRLSALGDRIAQVPEPLAVTAPESVSGTNAPVTVDKGGAYPGMYTPGGHSLPQVGLIDGVEVVPAAASACTMYGVVLAELPKRAVQSTNNSRKLRTNFLTALLNNPTDGINPKQFWTWCGRQLAAYEECWIAIDRDPRTGVPIRLTPAWTAGTRSVTGGPVDIPGARVLLNIPSKWAVGYGSTIQEYAIEDVLHVTGPTYDPFTGNVIRPLDGFARDAVGLHKMIVHRYTHRLSQGGHDNVVAEMPERKSDYDAFMSRYKTEIAGIWNSGKPFPMPHGSRLYPVSATDVERETVPMLNWITLEVARGWRIPPHLLYVRLTEGVSARARSDLAEMFLNWIRLGLESFVQSFSDEIDFKIVRPLDVMGFAPAMNIQCEFDLDHLTQGTPAQRAEIALKQRGTGVVKVDELRGTMKLEPLGGELGAKIVDSVGAAPTAGEGDGDGSPDDADSGADDDGADDTPRPEVR